MNKRTIIVKINFLVHLLLRILAFKINEFLLMIQLKVSFWILYIVLKYSCKNKWKSWYWFISSGNFYDEYIEWNSNTLFYKNHITLYNKMVFTTNYTFIPRHDLNWNSPDNFCIIIYAITMYGGKVPFNI